VAPSPPDLLVLHAVRLLGYADTERVASRFRLDRAQVEEHLEDARASGWVDRSSFSGRSGWFLTPRGKLEDEHRLAAELDSTGRRDDLRRAYDDFLVLNGRLLQAVTDWQTRPVPGDPLAANDHQDLRWDRRTLATLTEICVGLGPLATTLAGVLTRFGGYDARFALALEEAQHGDHRWVDSIELDSCHTVWFQLHEDLLATLGVQRGAGPA
jgi:hypothetical protein